jgi:hypothetical protein
MLHNHPAAAATLLATVRGEGLLQLHEHGQLHQQRRRCGTQLPGDICAETRDAGQREGKRVAGVTVVRTQVRQPIGYACCKAPSCTAPQHRCARARAHGCTGTSHSNPDLQTPRHGRHRPRCTPSVERTHFRTARAPAPVDTAIRNGDRECAPQHTQRTAYAHVESKNASDCWQQRSRRHKASVCRGAEGVRKGVRGKHETGGRGGPPSRGWGWGGRRQLAALNKPAAETGELSRRD